METTVLQHRSVAVGIIKAAAAYDAGVVGAIEMGADGEATSPASSSALKRRCEVGDDCKVMSFADFAQQKLPAGDAERRATGDRVCAGMANCLVDWAGDVVYYYSCKERWQGRV